MDNVTGRVIKYGSNTKKSKFNMISIVFGVILVLIGIMFLIIKAMSVEYLDANGFLYEKFFLLPLGFLSIFCGLIVFGSIGIKYFIGWIFSRKG